MEALRNDIRRDKLREDGCLDARTNAPRAPRAKAGEFDIKQDAGGIADIEFLAQYWALLWAQEKPPVAMFSDTIRQLESVASADLVPQETVDVLTPGLSGVPDPVAPPVSGGSGADRAGHRVCGGSGRL